MTLIVLALLVVLTRASADSGAADPDSELSDTADSRAIRLKDTSLDDDCTSPPGIPGQDGPVLRIKDSQLFRYFGQFGAYLSSPDPWAESVSVDKFLAQFTVHQRCCLYLCVAHNYREQPTSRIYVHYRKVLAHDPDRDQIKEYLQIDHEGRYRHRLEKFKRERNWHAMQKITIQSGLYSILQTFLHDSSDPKFGRTRQSSADLLALVDYVRTLPSPHIDTDPTLWLYLFRLLQKPCDDGVRYFERPTYRTVWTSSEWESCAELISARALTLSKDSRSEFLKRSYKCRCFHIVLRGLNPAKQAEILHGVLNNMMMMMVSYGVKEPDIDWVRSVYQALYELQLIDTIMDWLCKFNATYWFQSQQSLAVALSIIFNCMDFSDPKVQQMQTAGSVRNILFRASSVVPFADLPFRNLIAGDKPHLLSYSDCKNSPILLSIYLRSSLIDIEVACEMAAKSPYADQCLARDESLQYLDPLIWALVFHDCTMITINDQGFQTFCDGQFGAHPNRSAFESAILLIRFHDGLEFQDVVNLMEGPIDMGRFLSHLSISANLIDLLTPTLQNLFQFMSEENLAQDAVTQFEALFADAAASERYIIRLANLVCQGHANPLDHRMLRHLVMLHLDHDPEFFRRPTLTPSDRQAAVQAWGAIYSQSNDMEWAEFNRASFTKLLTASVDTVPAPESESAFTHGPISISSVRQRGVSIRQVAALAQEFRYLSAHELCYRSDPDGARFDVAFVRTQSELDALCRLKVAPIDSVVRPREFVEANRWVFVVLDGAVGQPLDRIVVPEKFEEAVELVVGLVTQSVRLFETLHESGISLARFDPRHYLYDHDSKTLTLIRLQDAALSDTVTDITSPGRTQMLTYFRQFIQRLKREFACPWYCPGTSRLQRLQCFVTDPDQIALESLLEPTPDPQSDGHPAPGPDTIIASPDPDVDVTPANPVHDVTPPDPIRDTAPPPVHASNTADKRLISYNIVNHPVDRLQLKFGPVRVRADGTRRADTRELEPVNIDPSPDSIDQQPPEIMDPPRIDFNPPPVGISPPPDLMDPPPSVIPNPTHDTDCSSHCRPVDVGEDSGSNLEPDRVNGWADCSASNLPLIQSERNVTEPAVECNAPSGGCYRNSVKPVTSPKPDDECDPSSYNLIFVLIGACTVVFTVLVILSISRFQCMKYESYDDVFIHHTPYYTSA